MNNVIKHSEAEYVLVRYLKAQRTMEIIDNGKGMPEHLKNAGLGLQYMQDKAQLLNGKLNFTNQHPGLSVQLRFEI